MVSDNHVLLASRIRDQGYIADEDLVSSLYLMDHLQKPLLIEGEAGVGKTEIAKCLAAVHDTQLIRLQCYEGLDAQHALYEWDYPRQLLAIQMASEDKRASMGSAIYNDEYLLKRPLYQAIAAPSPVVLLIDEVDRADEEFEALLLEVLSDFQISVPELGSIAASSIPKVVLTSNGVRDLSDALRRRCLYHYIGYPSAAKELEIVKAQLPDIEHRLATQIVSFVQNLRREMLRKTPGVAETLDWARSLLQLDVEDLESSMESLELSLTSLIKTREDLDFVRTNKYSVLQEQVSN